MSSSNKYDPDRFVQISGPLFEAVQRSDIFHDSKTFVDSVPKIAPNRILELYRQEKDRDHFNLKAFVYEHFHLPDEPESNGSGRVSETDSMDDHISELWEHLSRSADQGISDYSSLIPLPHPYIVPGGRFREIYYWDTYFTALGLAADDRVDTIEQLVRNFAHLVGEIGHVPNGNRQYYLSRSQPPFLVLLADLLVSERGTESIDEFIPALRSEYEFWMDGMDQLGPSQPSGRRTVTIPDTPGAILNRYWDDRPRPREESFREDYELGKNLNEKSAQKIYRHLRAGAESGWDFSSRWLRDGESLESIYTTDLLPVDLNALLYHLERRLAKWTGEPRYQAAAERRRQVFDTVFWNEPNGFYFDFDWKLNRHTRIWSLAGAYPLFTELASDQQAEQVAENIEQKFLKDGGVVSTLHDTGQQWDYPNGWAPLQWITVHGLLNYGHKKLAHTIARRWLTLNEEVFERTGRMMEKYNVCDTDLEAGGGEYPLQDGFGWTNGVAAAFRQMLEEQG